MNLLEVSLKRSVAVSLVIMGAASLAACQDETVDSAVYYSVDECVSGQTYSAEKCESDYKAAVAMHEEVAPAYRSKEECEAEFGAEKCAQTTEQHASGGFPFLPLLAGYMIGKQMGGGNAAAVAPQPVYRPTGTNAFVNAGGHEVARSTGPVKLSTRSPAIKTPAATTRTMARGGFGTRSMSVSA